MTLHYPDLGSASDWLKICLIQSEALPCESDASSEQYFCARSSDVVSRGNQTEFWRREMSAVSSRQ